MNLPLVITTYNSAAVLPLLLETFDREPEHGCQVVADSVSPSGDPAALMTRRMPGYWLKGSDADGADNSLARASEARRAVRSALKR